MLPARKLMNYDIMTPLLPSLCDIFDEHARELVSSETNSLTVIQEQRPKTGLAPDNKAEMGDDNTKRSQIDHIQSNGKPILPIS